MSTHRVVVVGAALSGAHTALQLRELGYEGQVTLLGAEQHLPYERPPLSKGFLTGDVQSDSLLVRSAEDYDRAGIDLRLGTRATGLDLDSRLVVLDDGDRIPYDAVVVATGSVNVRPPIPGIDLAGVHQLRTVEDAISLRAAAASAKRAVVVGTGFIGCELAASLTRLGLPVTGVDALPGPLWNVLGPRISGMVRDWHREHGVDLLGGVGVEALEGAGQVERVRLADGTGLDADLVVVGVGARPALGWLDAVGIGPAAGGLAVDDGGRTDQPGVFAVGDVAAVWDAEAGEHRRTEHFGSAVAQAARVAAAIAGAPLPAVRATPFWSEQYAHMLQYAGRHAPTDDLVVRPEPFAGFFVRDGVLTAIATVDNGKTLRRALPLLGRHVDVALLADPDVDLRTVA